MSDEHEDLKKKARASIFANLDLVRLSPGIVGVNSTEILTRVPVRKSRIVKNFSACIPISR